jgi:hydroxymethylpyrimidine kinase/phosphomethylpyrimidine kinase
VAVLTIAGSDSGGGAGIQADLKTFHALGVYGVSAITCVTAQNPDAVSGIEAVSAEMVERQVRAVCDGFPIVAAKTGMLYAADIIRVVRDTVIDCRIPNLVVDPVMVATSGDRLLEDDAVAAMRELLSVARVVTPNLPEAEVLCGHAITDTGLDAAAAEIADRYGVACVVKGGHVASATAEVVDVLCEGGETQAVSTPRVEAGETHGTGCTFSAALAALLAKGKDLLDAVRGAQSLVANALRTATAVGNHTPLAP